MSPGPPAAYRQTPNLNPGLSDSRPASQAACRPQVTDLHPDPPAPSQSPHRGWFPYSSAHTIHTARATVHTVATVHTARAATPWCPMHGWVLQGGQDREGGRTELWQYTDRTIGTPRGTELYRGTQETRPLPKATRRQPWAATPSTWHCSELSPEERSGAPPPGLQEQHPIPHSHLSQEARSQEQG